MRRDREPIAIGSVALAFAPTILKAIFGLGVKIHTTVENHGSNQQDCRVLVSHVDAIIGSLQYLEGNGEPPGHLIEPLNYLAQCLSDCYQFLEDYTSKPSIQQVLLSAKYKRKFESLNSDLSKSESLLYRMTMIGTAWKVPNEQYLTLSSFYLDEQRRHKNLTQSRHQHNLSPNIYAMCRSPVPSPHQSRPIRHSHSASNMSSSPRVLSRHASNGKLHQ